MSKRIQTPINNDTLEKSQLSYDLGNSLYSQHGIGADQNRMLKNTYKQQLDSLVQQRNQTRILQKQRQQRQKQQYNQIVQVGQESEKAKQASYKNYYNMLLSNQRQMQGSYVNPYTESDSVKEALIRTGMEENRRKLEYLEGQRKRVESERVSNYRNQLLYQMQDRKQRQNATKNELHRNQQQYRKFARLPQDIKQLQRERKLQEMNKYKEELDRARQEKQVIRGRANSSNLHQGTGFAPIAERHNAIMNPIPYNIQNPYILRQMGHGQNQGANRSYTGI